MGDIPGGNPFGIGSNPFAGANPFGANPFGGGMSPFIGEPKSSSGSSIGNDSFNIDDLVKKIDAKIAEIEKEEEESKKQEVNTINDVSSDKEIIDITNNEVVQDNVNESVSATIDKMYDDSTNDDDFFDDFFSDD